VGDPRQAIYSWNGADPLYLTGFARRFHGATVVHLDENHRSSPQVVAVANDNGGGQVVVSGDKAAVERALEIAKTKGAQRALLLPVSAPFHSSLLRPASLRLQDHMAGLQFGSPSIPLINNVDVAIATDPAAIKDALVRQAASPVRWVETVQKFAAEGVTHVIECGPGKVLAGLTKRIDGELTGDAIVDQASLDRILEFLK